MRDDQQPFHNYRKEEVIIILHIIKYLTYLISITIDNPESEESSSIFLVKWLVVLPGHSPLQLFLTSSKKKRFIYFWFATSPCWLSIRGIKGKRNIRKIFTLEASHKEHLPIRLHRLQRRKNARCFFYKVVIIEVVVAVTKRAKDLNTFNWGRSWRTGTNYLRSSWSSSKS